MPVNWDFIWGEAESGIPRFLYADLLELIEGMEARIRAYRMGLEVTIKSGTELYVAGGAININGVIYNVSSQLTISTGALSDDSIYYLYVARPAIESIDGEANYTLADTDFSVSATIPAYDHEKGAMYKIDDATKRWVANIYTGTIA